jgi:hypothetical protein
MGSRGRRSDPIIGRIDVATFAASTVDAHTTSRSSLGRGKYILVARFTRIDTNPATLNAAIGLYDRGDGV